MTRRTAITALFLAMVGGVFAAGLDEVKIAAEKGDPTAQYLMGLELREGQKAPQDINASIHWFTRASDTGYVFAQYQLGSIFESLPARDTNGLQAMKWYRAAAEQGFAPAQFNLARLYTSDKVTSKNNSEAFKWFLKAARQGYPEAQYEIGVAYDHGIGVLQNWNVAVTWYLKAALQNNAAAQNALGSLYASGHGVKTDLVEAYKWFTLAARNALPAAQPNRRWLVAELNAEQLREANARADAFIPAEPTDPFETAPSIFTQATDDALRNLLEKRSPIRLSTLRESAAEEYEFVARISDTNQSGADPLQIQLHAFANKKSQAILIETRDGLPYAYATKGYFIGCDPANPGHLFYYKGNGAVFKFDSQGWDFGLQLGLPDPPNPDDDVDFNLAGVLTQAAQEMENVRYDPETRTIKIGVGKRSRLAVTVMSDSDPGPFGLEKVVLKRGGQTIVFSKFVLGKLKTQMIPEINFSRFEALDLPMRALSSDELPRLSFQPPPGFPRDKAEKMAVEKLRSVLW